MPQINQNARTEGFGSFSMGEQSEVTANVGLGQMVMASGITAGFMALAAVLVEGVKYYWMRDDDDGVILRSEDGLEVRFNSIQDAEKAKDHLVELIAKAKEDKEEKEKSKKDEKDEKDTDAKTDTSDKKEKKVA